MYNKAPYLPAVLESVACEYAATGGEIVIVDDGSTDGSPALIAAFAATHTEAIVITQANKGVAAATNAGIARAGHPYLRLVDGDDRLCEGSTLALIDALRQTGCGFAYGTFTSDAAAIRLSNSPPAIIDDALAAMLRRQPFIPSTSLGLTEVMRQALPLPEDIRTAQDFSLGLRLAALTRFAALDRTCCLCPVESMGLSSAKGHMFRDTVTLATRIGQEQKWPPRYWRLAVKRNAGRARNYLRRHRKKCHGRVGGVSVLAIVVRVPFLWPYRRFMHYIAWAYDGFEN